MINGEKFLKNSLDNADTYGIIQESRETQQQFWSLRKWLLAVVKSWN